MVLPAAFGGMEALDRTIDTLVARLLDQRTAAGHWEGRLSSSALATATAVIALTMAAGTAGDEALIESGIAWLVANQNADGGWGDTRLSRSNLSTTALGWAGLRLSGLASPGSAPVAPVSLAEVRAGGRRRQVAGSACSIARDRAEAWIRRQLGDLTPDRLRDAVVARYGRDRTFSAPILSTLTLAGCLGDGPAAWRHVPQLPFELAALPQRWFRWLRLPVVSYALPALVAIGRLRHHHAPSGNPFARIARSAVGRRTLEAIRLMQPESGGYLEATPLTAFVIISLVGAGQRNHPIVHEGVRFLHRSVRSDGSWPIDTNLATWVTTLSVKALGATAVRDPETRNTNPGAAERRPATGDRERIRDWLLSQQHRRRHPFTGAAPGGWAWTDLSGGVPDADDTAGALIALRQLGPADPRVGDAAALGLAWLLDLQNADGGIPTFCRGWGTLPFDRSAPDLTAHALEAWDAWHTGVAPSLARRMRRAAAGAVRYLAEAQRDDGSWAPLWFGSEDVASEENLTYGTSRVVAALATDLARWWSGADECRRRGVAWLLGAQNDDGGWGGARGAPSSIEETGLAIGALAAADAATSAGALARGAGWLVAATDEGRRTPPAPIGLYFARLWYFEELHPLVFALGGLAAARRALGTV